jgi:V/A-type H+-transporting ATPase subunit I
VPRSESGPVRMARVAVAAPVERRRAVLVQIADAGVVQIDELGRADAAESDAARVLREAPGEVEPRLAIEEPDLERLRGRGDWARIAGEAELARRSADTVRRGPAVVLLGWVPESDLVSLTNRLAAQGASVARLPRPRVAEPPTEMPESRLRGPLRPLVRTYSVVPYEDVDPSVFAGITYVLMFGMMFGDVGHGLVLALLGLALARSTRPRFAGIRHLWPFPVAAGIVAAFFGLLYGEAFGPTGLVPTLWIAPLDEPVLLLVVAIGLGAVLIAASYVIGTVNRWREGGLRRALYAPTGLAGVALFLGAAAVAGGVAAQLGWLQAAGAGVAGLGLVLTFVGLMVEAGSGGSSVGQATIELFDTVIRIFANVVSFGRLAAFGLTHAAIGAVVWQGAQSLWGTVVGSVLAVALFLVGNALAFALEGLVVGVQALRLEYYELFSRIFTEEGRLFTPWHVPTVAVSRTTEE